VWFRQERLTPSARGKYLCAPARTRASVAVFWATDPDA